MSPRWRDEAQLLLTPRKVALRRYARGLRPIEVESAWSDVAGAHAIDWVAALEALEQLLASSSARGADATVIVSSHFVRYGFVPANDLLVTHEDELRFARHNFIRIHGTPAERWSVRVSPADGKHRGGALASAIEQDLVDALRALLDRHSLRARTLQPALMAVFNRARASLPGGGCRIVALEPGIAVSALLSPGWRRVHSQRMAGPDGLARVLQREQALGDESAQGLVTCVLPLLPLEQALPGIADAEMRELPALWSDRPPNEATPTAVAKKDAA